MIVGGSLLAWYGSRESTLDVDSIEYLDVELHQAVASVAANTTWTWNGSSEGGPVQAPNVKLEECDVLFTHPRLLVFGASLRQVFVMKLAHADARSADMAKIWSRTGFTNSNEVVDTYYEAYPHEDIDPYLGALVVQVANRAGYTIT